MSMLDDIKAAEAAADASKKGAVITARNMLREAEDNAKQHADELVVQARRAAKDTVAKAEAAAAVKAKSVIKERTLRDRAGTLKAREKVPAAVAYIVEKVVV